MSAVLERRDPQVEPVLHPTVETRLPTRRRIGTSVALLVIGVICLLAWGIGARNGDAAFDFSNVFTAGSHVVWRFPGGLVSMLLGVVVVAAAGYHVARGFTKRQLPWVLGAAVAAFLISFLIWASTGDPLNPISLPGLLGQSVTAAIPYILGALAGIVCERSGVINVAIEGQMLVGAFAGAMFASSANNLGIGVVAACVGGALIAVLLAIFAIRYLVNQVVLGVVLNTLALGLTNLGYHSFMAGESGSATYNAGLTLSPIRIPGLADIPVIGEALFDANILVYIAYALIVVVDVGLFRTRWGLRTRAVGEHPKAADTVGIKVNRTRYRNVIIGGLIAGLAGATLTVGGSGQFNGNISSGKGFIALAAVIFGRWSPRGAVAAALLFGFTNQLQTLLTIVQTPVTIPSAFLSMAPYIATVIAVAGLVGRVQAPAADGQPYTTD